MNFFGTRKAVTTQGQTLRFGDLGPLRWPPGHVLASLLVGFACGSSDSNDARPSTSAASAGAPSAPAPAEPSTSGSANAIPPEAVAAVAGALGMAADQVAAACGATFDACSATPGCNEILACAARSACTGSACYCTDSSCETDGPCRSVIEGAPGARTPDAENGSVGPAADAAGAVGECLAGVGGGPLPAPPTPPQLSNDGGSPSEDADAG
jgi:hypothetical protein